METAYDVCVLGTGLTECIVSGLLATAGYKVLHLDRNSYYGAECASINISRTYEMFKKGETPPESLGKDRDYNLDLIPKFMMGTGMLVKVLIHTNVFQYLSLRPVAGSYVYRSGKLCSVPVTPMEAATSPLMGPIQKYKVKKFLTYVMTYKEDDPKTHGGYDLSKKTMGELYSDYGLDINTTEFLGHAVALHDSEDYKNQPALPTLLKMKLYQSSLARYETNSPYIYVKWGLGELPQAFSRLCAIWGGTFILRTKVQGFTFHESGAVNSITAEIQGEKGPQTAKCKYVVADPSYFPKRVKQHGAIVRSICILDHRVVGTNDNDSAQVIIPARQCGRQHDIYISCISDVHKVVPKGKFVCTISTTVETKKPGNELAYAFNMLKPITERFVWVTPNYLPVDDGTSSKIFISKSIDATMNFQSVLDDVWRIYKSITGSFPDLSKKPVPPGQEAPEGGAPGETSTSTAST